MAPPVIRVGLVGFGTVGRAFTDVLQLQGPAVARWRGVHLALTHLAVRSLTTTRTGLPPVHVVDSAHALAADPHVDIVVEASGAADAADWIHLALARGAHVVTANKQSLARDPRLLALIAQGEPRLHCEGSVAAAIPIVRALRESLVGERIRSVRGVLNGTSTFLLSHLEIGQSWDRALAEAQRLGYTERDAGDDISGRDSAAKLAILATLAWRRPVSLTEIDVRGVSQYDAEAWVRQLPDAHHIRLVAHATIEHETGQVRARVAPEVIGPADALATATGITNVVQVDAEFAGALTWRGPGAGGPPTASALFGDVLSAANAIAQSRLAGAAA